ncbi:hybrid sensor histidine kinase/response regulator [Ramlibacter albus]|uniref:Chemotaxis protein CheA n=1 Tax=Ramlibacter albus TaxID=2079448 RepID=A0A923S5I8_9BURK|nr:hybrid sensor histidine kinase/response regulator [Ramlibacter albus]MBC5768038.1 response regulator [Ramlibacter albus]
MKLKDLVEALATEVERAGAQLEECLGTLAQLGEDDPVLFDLCEQYSGQAQRMGEAAELAGFPGLQAVCDHVLQNGLLLTVTPAGERGPLVDFLRAWPPLVVFYLRNLSDPSAAVGLVDHLCTAPDPLPEDAARKIVHMLGAMPLQVEAGADDEQPQRPVLASAEDVALEMPADVDERLLEGFRQESPEQARYLVALARNMAAGGDSSDVVAAKRVAHTLKGSASIIGLRGIASVSHHLEDILEHFEEAGGAVARPAAEALLDAAYCVEQMVGYVMGEDEYPQQAQRVLQDVLDLANRIDRGESLDAPLARSEEAPAVETVPQAAVAASTSGNAMRVSVRRIDELFRVSGELAVHGAAMEARLKALVDSSRQLLAQNLRVQKRLFELETVVDVRSLATMRARAGSAGRDDGFDSLELDQYSELHSTSHALIEEAADARAMALRLEEEIAQLSGLQSRQQRLGKDMQHLVIGTRMTEVGVLEPRLHRNVRSTCQATGKQAELVLKGGGTLIDADVLSRLAEPLMHLLRNAVDHGIESPEVRGRAGKSPVGRVMLDFSRQGQQVVLRCADDGRGLDLPAIRNRAIERGLISAEQVLGDDEIARLILLPGFSTRDAVSEVSGRGVGMDVVHEWVNAMNGSIRISSVAGSGSTIELRFAASLTTMQSLVVEAAGQRFALPAVHVEQAVPRGLGEFEQVGDSLAWRHADRIYPARLLAEAAGLPRDAGRALVDHDVVIVRFDNRSHALAVERLVDARELLVKNPGRYARHVRGVAGLSILGDGSVAVNLELPQLLARASRRVHDAGGSDAPTASKQEVPGVLIVDDSLSVRTALRNLVQDAGFRVEAARDGLEAIESLRGFRPKIVLTDLEMPNMNGVELTSHLKARADTKDLPVIMITSRSQEKHRRMAQQAGVDAYLTKPYNDGELLRTIREAIHA